MRWLSDVEGCFSTSLCPADQRARCALDLLVEIDHGVIFRRAEGCGFRGSVRGMFSTRYVPRDERERFSREFLELKQDSESVTKITRMFIERAMFCPEFASEQAQMS